MFTLINAPAAGRKIVLYLAKMLADALGADLWQNWGGNSDPQRIAFHFEKISYSRKGNTGFYEIPEPRLSVAISDTPNQVLRLIPSVEDGLFSRNPT